MFTALAVSAIFATSTRDICQNPIKGGRGEPHFCILDKPREIKTPHFQITVPANLLVGIDREGRRLVIQGSIWQSPVNLIVYSVPHRDQEAVVSRLGRCGRLESAAPGHLICITSGAGVIAEEHLIQEGSEMAQLHFGTSGVVEEVMSQFRAIIASFGLDSNET